jgi:hypothetical protein
MNSTSESEVPVGPTPQPGARPPKPSAKKKSLLEWWAIFPVASFIVIEAIFGGPSANNQHEEGYSVGYVVGGCLFGLVISLLFAWVAYRVTRRSQLVATLVFSLVIEFVALTVLGNWALERSRHATAKVHASRLADPARRD